MAIRKYQQLCFHFNTRWRLFIFILLCIKCLAKATKHGSRISTLQLVYRVLKDVDVLFLIMKQLERWCTTSSKKGRLLLLGGERSSLLIQAHCHKWLLCSSYRHHSYEIWLTANQTLILNTEMWFIDMAEYIQGARSTGIPVSVSDHSVQIL